MKATVLGPHIRIVAAGGARKSIVFMAAITVAYNDGKLLILGICESNARQ
jgi:hypothetical protein